MQPAIFLDRDGVIIQNRPNYVRSWQDVEIIPGSLEALAQLRDSPFKIVIITNQSAVGRGIISLATVEEINRRLVSEIERVGGRVDAVYICPHKPSDRCTCRKPEPGLIQQAAADLSLDLSRSILVGDALTDLQAGRAAGVGSVALVRTGRGQEQALSPQAASMRPFPIYDHLAHALGEIITL